jgi:hypothetical protein
MDGHLYLDANISQEEYAEYLYNIYKKTLNEDVKINKREPYISLCFQYQTIFIDIEEIIGLDVVDEELGCKVTNVADYQIASKYFLNAIEVNFKLIKEILNSKKYNVLFTDDSLIVFLMRLNGKYSAQFERIKRSNYLNIPYEILGIEIEEMELGSKS